jgi:hypothetical protein
MYITLLLHASAYDGKLNAGGKQTEGFLVLNTCSYKTKTRVLNKIIFYYVCNF